LRLLKYCFASRGSSFIDVNCKGNNRNIGD